MKAQAAMEFMIITGVGLLMLVPISYYAFISYSDNVKLSIANTAAASITNNVDKEYASGPDSSTTISITMPDGLDLNHTMISGARAIIGVKLANCQTTDVSY